jgi:hypothetical protein
MRVDRTQYDLGAGYDEAFFLEPHRQKVESQIPMYVMFVFTY